MSSSFRGKPLSASQNINITNSRLGGLITSSIIIYELVQ